MKQPRSLKKNYGSLVALTFIDGTLQHLHLLFQQELDG